MARYKILIRKSAAKELEDTPGRDLRKIVRHIQSLAQNPRSHGSQKLSHQEQYRVRQGDYRVVYSIQDKERTIHVVKIGHRREVYRS